MRNLTLLMLTLAVGSGCAAKKNLAAAQSDLASCEEKLQNKKDALDKAKAAADTERELANKRLEAYRALVDQFKEAFGTDDFSFELRNGRLVVIMPNQVLFDSGKSTLKDEGKKALDQVATVMKRHPKRRFLVAGHTDNRPIADKGGDHKSNWDLSASRALKALKYLEKAGVDPKNMGATGYGEHQPIARNDSDENMQKNRRLEIVILPTLEEMPPLPKEL